MHRLLILMLFSLPQMLVGQGAKQQIVTTDLTHFWRAFGCVQMAADSAAKMHCLQTQYLAKASPGLRSLMRVRRYRPEDLLEAIERYPLFWTSIRKDLQRLGDLLPAVEANLNALNKLYPRFAPAKIYFSVGAFRTPGTVDSGRVLIGSEMALAGATAVLHELPQHLQVYYRDYQPRNTAAFLCTHELVHTQQKPMADNLLSRCLYEGIAEFAATLATGKPPNSPNIVFGQQHQAKIFEQFAADLFLMSNDGNWLWGENRNALKVRDLGYYVGYAIAESHYRRATNKRQTLQELIELDYQNEAAVERIVDGSRLLPQSLKRMKEAYERSRPTVASISPFANESRNVAAGKQRISIHFSQPLNGYNTSIDFGPLGQPAFPNISRERSWSADGKTWSFEAELKPGKHYQLLISDNFRTAEGLRLRPFLLDFTTADEVVKQR